MKKKFLLLLLLAFFSGVNYAQQKTMAEFRFVVGKDMLFVPWEGNGENLKKLSEFINANRESITSGKSPIYVDGYCINRSRAKVMANRVKSELIIKDGMKEEYFLTKNIAESYNGINNVVVVRIEVIEPEIIGEEKPEFVAVKEQPKEDPRPEIVIQEQPREDVAQVFVEEVDIEECGDVFTAKQSKWYIGVGGGVSFGRATFASFAMDKSRPGFNVGVLGGYKFNKILSAELSLDYTRMTMGAYDCCQLLWLSNDGNRYVAPVSGRSNYRFTDLHSTMSLYGLGAHLNIDLVGIWKESSKWSALVSPAIYTVYSSASIKQHATETQVLSSNAFHFGVGIDLGAGYQISNRCGLRLTTGVNYLTGKGIDGLPKEEHNVNYVWNSDLKLTIKL